MKLYTNKITIYLLLLLFNKNAVYCRYTEYLPSMIKASNNDDIDLIYTLHSPNHINDISNIVNIIKTSFPFERTDLNKPLTRELVYKINVYQQYELTYPNKIDKINFNDYTINFDSSAKLPSYNVQYIHIYTCEHYNPLMLCMYGNSRYYLYSLDPKTNKWNNYKLRYDERFSEYTDENDVSFYTKSHSKGSLYDLFSRDFVGYKDESKEIAKLLCKTERCVAVDTNLGNNLSIYMNHPRTIISKCSYIDIYETTPLTIKIFYKIYGSQQYKLIYPNKLDKIEFNSFILEFDENAKLPNSYVSYITINTCEHYNPFLMYMYGDSRYYYYSLDPNTKKWNNHRLKYDTRFTEHIDENETNYYKMFIDYPSSTTTVRFEAVELVKCHCSDGKCVNVNTTDDNYIEIYMKNSPYV